MCWSQKLLNPQPPEFWSGNALAQLQRMGCGFRREPVLSRAEGSVLMVHFDWAQYKRQAHHSHIGFTRLTRIEMT